MVPGQPRGEADAMVFHGAELLRLAAGELDGDLRTTARRLMRQVLAAHLGNEPLKSRDLFRRQRQATTVGKREE